MNLSRFRLSRSALPDSDSPAVNSLLGFVLGYDSVTDAIDSPSARNPFVATLCHDIDDAGLVADWAALEAGSSNSVFQTYSWQRGILTHLTAHGPVTPFFITVRDERSGQAVAILPLQLRATPGLKVIEYLGVQFCDTCQPLLSDSFSLSAAATKSFVRAVLIALPRADVLRLSKMQHNIFGRANPFGALRGTAGSADQTFPVELAPDSIGFVAATSAYKAYQKQWRKLSRRDGIAFELFDTPETIASAFDAMIDLRASRFCKLDRADLLDDAEVRDFYRAMALLPDGERVVRIAGLKVGDTYTAFIYMMDHGGKFSTVISAIDNSVGNAYAPGLILFTKIFEHAIAAGYVHGDMGIGYMHYKTRFAARQNPLFIWERALSLQGGAYLTGLTAARRAKHWAKQNATARSLVEKVLGRKIAVTAAPAKVEATDED